MLVSHLQDHTGRLLKHMDISGNDLDSLFAELDANLAHSRQIFSQVAGDAAAPASHAAHITSAASSNSHNYAAVDQHAAHGMGSDFQVPAYVHIGQPLVTDQPETPKAAGSGISSHQVDW